MEKQIRQAATYNTRGQAGWKNQFDEVARGNPENDILPIEVKSDEKIKS